MDVLRTDLGAVSYTHLDVYKRQEEYSTTVRIPDGVQAIYITYRGGGNVSLLSFPLKKEK